MKRPYDLTGHRFGALVCLMQGERTLSGKVTWLCQCDCGNTITRQADNLKIGGDKSSCGCIHRGNYSHGHSIGGPSSTYGIWCAMKRRCTNPEGADWDNYGGRGITVCDRWMNSFENFLVDMGCRPDGLSIDRINVNGNYEPDNCRWADSFEQAANKCRSTKG